MSEDSDAIIKELQELKGHYLSQVREEHFSQVGPLKFSLKEIHFTSHKIAGAAPSYGLVRLGELARKVEDYCSAGDEDEAKKLWKELIELFEQEEGR